MSIEDITLLLTMLGTLGSFLAGVWVKVLRPAMKFIENFGRLPGDFQRSGGVRVPRGLTLWLLFIADEFRDLFSAFGRSLLTRGAFCRFK